MELKYDQMYTIISKREIDKAVNLNSHLLCCLVMQAAVVSVWTDQKAGLHGVWGVLLFGVAADVH
jgi:hypothetical protein